MRKIIISFVCLLLVSVVAYADQTLNGRQTREWDQASQSKILNTHDYAADSTAFTNLVATGHQATGNPGYIALMAVDGTGTVFTYYLWVDPTVNSGAGALRMASFTNIKNYSSFPYGDWRSGTGFGAGTKVSGQ